MNGGGGVCVQTSDLTKGMFLKVEICTLCMCIVDAYSILRLAYMLVDTVGVN